MELISEYNKLPQGLQEQLTVLQEKYYNNEAVLRPYFAMLKYFKEQMSSDPAFRNANIAEKEMYGNILFRLALYKTLDIMDVVEPSNIGKLFCYNTKDKPYIILTKIIKPKYDKKGKETKRKDKQVIVAEGKVNDRKVIVKWLPGIAKHLYRTIYYEINIYRQLRHIGCPCAMYDRSYRLWGQQVLVLEYLNPITKDDDEYEMGIQIINQLRKIHRFGCHSDIKLGNIACRRKGEYILIDYGGMTMERHNSGTGWHRWTWTKHVTRVDPEEKNKMITEAIELMELGYTMKALQNIKRGDKDADPRRGFTGRLAKYIRRCQRIDPKRITDRDYDDLIEILSKD